MASRPALRVVQPGLSPADVVLAAVERRDELRRLLVTAEHDAKAAAATYSTGRGYRAFLTPEQAKAEIERGRG